MRDELFDINLINDIYENFILILTNKFWWDQELDLLIKKKSQSIRTIYGNWLVVYALGHVHKKSKLVRKTFNFFGGRCEAVGRGGTPLRNCYFKKKTIFRRGFMHKLA
jgi:hypothetical protein